MLIDEMIRFGIQNIDEKVKAMRHILEWIDLNEQAPGYKQECIVQFESGEVQGGWLYGGQSRSGEHIFLESHAEYEVSMDVAFWMSLPPAQPEQLAAFPPTI